MKKGLATVLLICCVAVSASDVEAQELRGFAAATVVSDLNDQRFPGVSGGVLWDLPTPWFSVGAEGEMFVSWPYVAGRGTLFGQANVLRRTPVNAFVVGGVGFGEAAGPMAGGGMEIRPRGRRLGLRVSFEDYLARVQGFDCAEIGYPQAYCDANLRGGRSYTAHQFTVRIGVLF